MHPQGVDELKLIPDISDYLLLMWGPLVISDLKHTKLTCCATTADFDALLLCLHFAPYINILYLLIWIFFIYLPVYSSSLLPSFISIIHFFHSLLSLFCGFICTGLSFY